MKDELKPCPFCGCKPNSWHHRSPFGISNVCDVYCNRDDHNVVVTGNSLEEAIAAWNTRHEPEELPEWAKEAINTRILMLIKMQDKISRGGPSIERELLHNRIEVLKWILSLRKPEVKNE